MSKIRPPNICVSNKNTIAGRGVIAQRDFRAGEIVEEAPVLLLDCGYDELDETLKCYVFSWNALTALGVKQAIAFGYGSLYNNANPANMRYLADVVRQSILFVAEVDIAEGTELTINYNGAAGASESEGNNWFVSRGIEPL
ncbi:MAG: SET domain-containing protein-lysine N-methyltransferase [Azonexus sp.]